MNKRYVLILCSMLLGHQSVYVQTGSSFYQECVETTKAGLPSALLSALLWKIAYAVPNNWPDVEEPTAGFIRQTWKDQGFTQADTVILKKIPADSFMAKVVVYTQEFPGALAVGIPFIKRVEKLLEEKTVLEQTLQSTNDTTHYNTIRFSLQELEKELDECRFVCGHERVHQERAHAHKILLVQCIAPFVVYLFSKQAAALCKQYGAHWLAEMLEWRMSRSAAEISIFWLTAHIYEQQADVYASTDPQVIEAGIRLFKRAQKQKVPEMGPVGYRTRMMAWLLKYTHPVLSERIWYLTTTLKKIQPSNNC